MANTTDRSIDIVEIDGDEYLRFTVFDGVPESFNSVLMGLSKESTTQHITESDYIPWLKEQGLWAEGEYFFLKRSCIILHLLRN